MAVGVAGTQRLPGRRGALDQPSERAGFRAAQIAWLRAYSNYLTPRIGITSADTWAALAIVTRNIILNWLIIMPLVCAALLTLKLIAAVSVRLAESAGHPYIIGVIGAFGVVPIIVAIAFTTRYRPSRRRPDDQEPNDNLYEGKVLLFGLAPTVVAAIATTVFCTSQFFLVDVWQKAPKSSTSSA